MECFLGDSIPGKCKVLWVWGIETTTYTQNDDLWINIRDRMRSLCRKIGYRKERRLCIPKRSTSGGKVADKKCENAPEEVKESTEV